MSFSRIIIEQRLADLELALKRQEELITSQRDAIKNLRDLIQLDQNIVSNIVTGGMEHGTPTILHHSSSNASVASMYHSTYSSNHADASISHLNLPMAPPIAPMTLPRPTHTPNNAESSPPGTASILGQRGYISFQDSQLDQSSQDVSALSYGGNSMIGSSYSKRARLEVSMNSSRSNAAPIMQPLKRRRALDRIRQLSPLFSIAPPIPSAATVSTSNSTISYSASAHNISSNNTSQTKPISIVPVSVSKTSTGVHGTPSTTEKPIKAGNTPAPAPAPASYSNAPTGSATASTTKVVPAALPLVPKGFNYGGVQSPSLPTTAIATITSSVPISSTKSLTVTITPPLTSKPPDKTIDLTDTTSSSPFQPRSQSQQQASEAHGHSTTSTTVMASNNATSFMENRATGSQIKPTVLPLPETSSSSFTTAARTSQDQYTINKTTLIPAGSTTANIISNFSATSPFTNRSSSSSSNSVGLANNLSSVPPLSSAGQQILQQMSDLAASASPITLVPGTTTSYLRAQAEFLRSLSLRMQSAGVSARDLLEKLGGKKILVQWLKHLEEDNEELTMDGINILERVLHYFSHDTSFSIEEVVETRIDKLLRRIYKKYNYQKLSLGDPLLDKIRSLWSTCRTLFKEANGDDAGTD